MIRVHWNAFLTFKNVFITDRTMLPPLLTLLLCSTEGCCGRLQIACCHLGPCIPARACCGGPLCLWLPPFLLPQTLSLLPVLRLLLLPRLLRPLLVWQLLRRLALLLPTLCGLVGGTGILPVTEGKLQWLMPIEVMRHY